MEWDKLLSGMRLDETNQNKNEDRNEFHKDYDRIIFSSSFRRLARKTQVHPLSRNDHLHNRLTHSLEVGSVGRSLTLKVLDNLPEDINKDDLPTIVQAACMAHDIGNPPFGHAGEYAIREWFEDNQDLYNPEKKLLDEQQLADLTTFEGNAQGIRLLSRVENNYRNNGLNLTYATLASIVKYPWTSTDQRAKNNKKFNIYKSELETYKRIADNLGLSNETRWNRHPLSFLMEAADDICNNIIDIEDALEAGILSIDEVACIFRGISGEDGHSKNSYDDVIKYRGTAIEKLIELCAKEFINNQNKILSGEYLDNIFESIKSYPASGKTQTGLVNAEKITKSKIFNNRRKIELEVGSYSTIRILLDSFIPAIQSYINKSCKLEDCSFREKRVLHLLGSALPNESVDHYEAYMIVVDFVSGMTDNYATFIAKQINGSAK